MISSGEKYVLTVYIDWVVRVPGCTWSTPSLEGAEGIMADYWERGKIGADAPRLFRRKTVLKKTTSEIVSEAEYIEMDLEDIES